MSGATYTAKFGVGDKVIIDGHNDLSGVVPAVLWRVEEPQTEVSWWTNGTIQSAWLATWRLSTAP